MNDAVIQDLKQFISGTISQQTADLRSDIDGIKVGLSRLESKVDDLSAGMAEAVDTISEVTHAQYLNHETRITKLEQQAA